MLRFQTKRSPTNPYITLSNNIIGADVALHISTPVCISIKCAFSYILKINVVRRQNTPHSERTLPAYILHIN